MPSRTNPSPVSVLAINLDRKAGDALHRQIETSLRDRIRSGAPPAGGAPPASPGRPPAGVAVPASRVLADELGLSRGVVVEAYAQLVAEGYLTSRSGSYTQVAPRAAAVSVTATTPHPSVAARPPRRPAVDFGSGRGDLQAF